MFFASLFRKPLLPPLPLLVEDARTFKALDQNLPLEAYEFVVYDTELTGLNPRRDQIVSIGAVRIKNLRILAGDTFHVHVKPSCPLPKNSTLIHRITPEKIAEAPPLAEVLPDFFQFCHGALLVGHYIGLDAAFINRAARTLYGQIPVNPCLDTMRLAQAYTEMSWVDYHDRFRMNVSYNLADLASAYQLPAFPRHDALADAMQTAYLFLYLVGKMRHHGVNTLKSLFDAGKSSRWIL